MSVDEYKMISPKTLGLLSGTEDSERLGENRPKLALEENKI